jgi:hypothetical protein
MIPASKPQEVEDAGNFGEYKQHLFIVFYSRDS